MESMLTCWINITISTVGSCWWTLLSCLLSQLIWPTEPAGRRLFNFFSRQRCGKSSQKHSKKQLFLIDSKPQKTLENTNQTYSRKYNKTSTKHQLKLISGSWRISFNGVMEALARHFSGAWKAQNDGCFGRKGVDSKRCFNLPIQVVLCTSMCDDSWWDLNLNW